MISGWFSRVFDTPGEACVCNGSGSFRACGVARARVPVYVYLLLPDGGAFRPVPGARAAWWWFENSRAYLYYFFIVNDCQSIVGSPCFGEWPGGLEGRWGFRAMRLSL